MVHSSTFSPGVRSRGSLNSPRRIENSIPGKGAGRKVLARFRIHRRGGTGILPVIDGLGAMPPCPCVLLPISREAGSDSQ